MPQGRTSFGAGTLPIWPRPLSRDGMLHMMFKLGQCAEKKWRRLRGFDYLAKVVTGIKFKDGVEVTTDNQAAA